LARCRKDGKVGAAERASVRSLQRFARIYPANFRSFQLLATAAVLAARGKGLAARDHLRQVLDEAAQQGHELVAAVAAERLAASYDSVTDQPLRDECLRTAAFGYARFGARAKAAQVKRRYPELASWSERPESSGADVDVRVEAVMQAASTIAEETSSARLAPTLTRVVATAASAERALLVQNIADQWIVLTGWQLNVGEIVNQPVNLEGCDSLARGVVRYVCRTNSVVELDSGADQRFADDPYLSKARPRSVLCVPLAHRGEVNAVIYLENSLYTPAFTPEQRKLVTLLGTQAAIALANADNQRLQVEAVQSRVNPHFLYNALSLVAELIATSPERAEEVVLKLSRLYRSMLSSSVDRMVSLEQELALVRDYLELETARFGDKFAVHWQVDHTLGSVRVPALLLQPLVENAVHHGVRRKLESGVVGITVAREGSSLLLGVSDDGPGWYRSTAGNGFGLRSIEKRLKLLYGGAAQLTILRENGVSVQLRLPLD
jgi:GAF domain-containing protein